MDGTTVRHINPRMLGLLERLDDFLFKTTQWIHRKNTEPDFYAHSSKKPHLLVHRALHSIRTKPVEQIVQPCPGIYTLLEVLKNAKIPMGIVSNGLGKGYGHDILQKFDLEKYFIAQVFREDIERSKPHPDPIIKGIDRMEVPLTSQDVVWYIGDRHKDIVAALAANDIVQPSVVPFAYGIKSAIAILEKGLSPEQIIMNYTDFAARIFNIVKP